MSDNHEAHAHHISSFTFLAWIWVGLLVFTAMTVFLADVQFSGSLGILVAMAIATLKAFLVVYYYMHLKFDSKVFSIMVGICFAVLAVVIFVTFLDYIFR